MKTRKEFDSIGSINVPVDKYWGASTQRSSKYFDIGDFLVRPIVIKSTLYFCIKNLIIIYYRGLGEIFWAILERKSNLLIEIINVL